MRTLPRRSFLLAAAAAPFASGAEKGLSEADIFTSGTGGYHTYRIPALLVTKRGTVLAFCEGRKTGGGDAGDIDLMIRRSRDHGRTWGPMEMLYEEGGAEPITIGNPCPASERGSGAVHLLFSRNNQRLFHMSSRDDGRTFSRPVEITAILEGLSFPWTRLGSGPGHGIQLRSNRLLMPLWINDKIHGNYRSMAVYSDDKGASWKPGGIIGPEVPGTNECMIYERDDATVVINMRGRGEKMRAEAESRDGGLTWSVPRYIPDLPDPICQGSILAIPGQGVVFANAADAAGRIRLTARFSRDGRVWNKGRVLQAGPSAYSDMAWTRDKHLLVLYESGERKPYERLRLARLPLALLKAK